MRVPFGLGLAAAVVLAGCSETPSTAPNGPSYQIGTGPACSPSTLQKYARSLFGSRSPVLDLAKQITAKNANSAQATAVGFSVMSAVAGARDAATAWSAGNASDGANLTVQLIACMDVTASGQLSFDAFNSALGTTGGYEVRGGATDPTGAVLSGDGHSGVQAPTSGFPTWLGGRALFYGSPISTFSTELFGGYAFDWSTVRPNATAGGTPAALNGQGIVGLCAVDANAAIPGQARVQEHGTILPIQDAPFLTCPSTLSDASASTGSLLARIGAFGRRLLTPEPAYAAVAAQGGTGGLAGGFSPFELVDPGHIVMTFVSEPADGVTNAPIPGTPGADVAVKVTGANGTVWQGVHVKLEAVVNNGSFVATCNGEADTQADGVAHFPNVSVNKPGGYFFIASTVPPSNDVDVTAFAPDSTNSARFNLQMGSDTSPCP